MGICCLFLDKNLIKGSKFCNGFGLNLKSELFLIRDKLQEQSNNEKAKYEEKNKAWLEAKKTFYANESEIDIDKYAHYRKMEQELEYHYKKNFKAYWDLISFEYFLMKYRYIKDHDAIESIFKKRCEFK
jgi:hypothetical protein